MLRHVCGSVMMEEGRCKCAYIVSVLPLKDLFDKLRKAGELGCLGWKKGRPTIIVKTKHSEEVF